MIDKRFEIGSEFSIDEVLNVESNVFNIFDYLSEFNCYYFDSGRSALKSLLKSVNPKKVLMPNYICESVRNCFFNCEIQYYQVNEEFKINWDDLLRKINSDHDIIYLNFFNGCIDDNYDLDSLLKLKEEFKFIIIEDTTHSIFTNKNIVGDYCVCSLRKWLPIPDGGVLYTKLQGNFKANEKCKWSDYKRKGMILKNYYLNSYDVDNKEKFLMIFSDSDRLLDKQQNICKISDQTKELLKYIDIHKMINQRLDNFNYLSFNLRELDYKIISCNAKNQIPLFLTIAHEQRDKLRSYLIEKRIYCPVHWPLYDELKKFKDILNYQSKELSIPIDQRYSIKEMKYIVDCMANFNKGV